MSPRAMAADGTRDVKRIVKRRVGDSWEYVDHMTRNVRPAEADSDSSDDDDYAGFAFARLRT